MYKSVTTRPLLIKRQDVLPPNLLKSQSREIGCYNDRIALKLDRHLGSSDWKLYTLISRLRYFTRSCGKTSYRRVNRSPAVHTATWWRHQMEAFFALLALCAGNSPVTGEFPSQRPVKRSFDVFFYLPQNKRLSKQSRRRWFETLSRSLWCHCNDLFIFTRFTDISAWLEGTGPISPQCSWIWWQNKKTHQSDWFHCVFLFARPLAKIK